MQSVLTILASETADLEEKVGALSIRTILISSLVLVVLLVLASIVVNNKKYKSFKTPLFTMIAATIAIPSLFLVGSTIYVNVDSESKGPVHWHTDYELWVCGEEIEHRDPYKFLSNKIGTATYHEHDDKRIHLEGVVGIKYYDASFEKFMLVTEGKVTENELVIATDERLFEDNDGKPDGDQSSGNQDVVRGFVVRDEDGKPEIAVKNGDTCGDGQPAEVQAFVYSYNKENDTYQQTKLDNPARYIMRDESIVPPGDCLIVEFGPSKAATNYLCDQYGVRDSERCTEFGVKTYNPELCSIREVNKPQAFEEPTELDESEEGTREEDQVQGVQIEDFQFDQSPEGTQEGDIQ